jgi:hypothetical protein
MDVIYLIPSFWPPTRAAQILVCQPLFSLKSAGLPFVFYKWRVKIGSFQDGGWFVWFWPQEIYGIYSRQDPGDRAEKIIDFLVKKTGDYRKLYGRETENKLPDLEEVSQFDSLTDASNAIAEAADSWASIPVRRNKFR